MVIESDPVCGEIKQPRLTKFDFKVLASHALISCLSNPLRTNRL